MKDLTHRIKEIANIQIQLREQMLLCWKAECALREIMVNCEIVRRELDDATQEFYDDLFNETLKVK